MNAKELRLKNTTELERLATELRIQLRDLRFKVATRQLTKVHQCQVLKHQLALVETIRNEQMSAS